MNRGILDYLEQRLRSWIISRACGVMNWVSSRLGDYWDDHDVEEPSRWVDFLTWIDGLANAAFARAYAGSDEELDQATDIPAEHLNDRQRAYVQSFTNPIAQCYGCCWVGFLWQAEDYICPSCGDDGIHWTDRSAALVPYTDRRALAVRPAPVCTLAKRGGAS